MDYLPIFIDVRDKPVLVVGGGDVAARKIEFLRRAGAQIEIAALALCEELIILKTQKVVNWIADTYHADLLDNVFLVIAATDNSELNQRIFADASERRMLVNVVDDQPKCSFIFPSIVDRSPLVVAISSSGKAPVLARMLREKLETLLPHHLGKMAVLAGKWREKVKQRFKKMPERRYFWERVFNGVFASQVAAGDERAACDTLDTLLDAPATAQGEIVLVGAGPGDATLLTLRALQVMQQADVVLYDHLVSEEILELVRRDAEKICVGKRAHQHTLPQAEINQLMVTLARQGQRVVRLKGGDPFIFGRGGEELQAAAQAGIPFQVVPGVTAAAGATAYAGIPLTHRDYAQSVVFITGHCRAEGEGLDWSALARPHQTLAIYMGAMKAADISAQLIAHGRAASTPVAVIGRGTRSDQQVLTGTLQELEVLALEAPTPALLVIGEVVTLHQQLAWFQHITQPAGRASDVANLV
ncbi:MAG: Siroheme synthase [Candidatus Erwinia impunctatus]